ncbi:MAG: hypothetical protein EXR72_22075 [Myxococcales bacterium]|nr:hypothetical protein [Myxococcales bacterium]
MIAERGGGRFHFTQDAQNIPKIFTKETTEVARSALVEEAHASRSTMMSTEPHRPAEALVDTNVLVYASDRRSPYHAAAVALRDEGIAGGLALCVAPQILRVLGAGITPPGSCTSTVPTVAPPAGRTKRRGVTSAPRCVRRRRG